MVIRLPPQQDSQLQREFTALHSTCSSPLGNMNGDDEFSIWKCAVNGLPDACGYWIGKLPSYYGFLVVKPITLNGTDALEAVRGWVDPNFRSRGIFSALLRQASSTGKWLVGDTEGMTEDAHTAWQKVTRFERSYFDKVQNVFVSREQVPEQERFTAWENGSRWLLTLRPLSQS